MTLMPDSSNNLSALNADIHNAGRLLSDPPGEVLKRARQARKLDLETAADQLNLSVQVVRALEEDAYEKLPSPTFIRGYIRCYARLLKLSGDDLVRSYEGVAIEQQSRVQNIAETSGVKPQKFRKSWAVLGGVIVIVAIAIGFVVTSDESPQHVAPAIHPEADASLVPETRIVVSKANVESIPAVAAKAESPAEAITAAKVLSPIESIIEPTIEPTTASIAAVAAVPLAQPVVASPVVASIEAVADNTAAIEVDTPLVETNALAEAPIVNQAEEVQTNIELSTLIMTFSGECWVEVWDATGKRIYANLRKAGQRVSLQGVAPIDVKLGDGSMAKLTFNGSPVLFASSKRTSVAHVTLGE